MDLENLKNELKNFLGGTFHQDIESPESALNEIIEEEDRQWLLEIISHIDEFIQSSITEQEKNEFIQNYAEIYFPALGVSPIEWLKKVATQLKEAVQEKEE